MAKTALTTNKNASYKTVNGVTYFKLVSGFEGDYTKNCGLLGEDIDGNFFFLRGYDIESVRMEDRNLIIERVDKTYDPIVIPIGDELGQPSFSFDRQEGELVINYPDGTTARVGGFVVEGKDIRIANDDTLEGDGTFFDPIRLSPNEKTGTYAPANEVKVLYRFDYYEKKEIPGGYMYSGLTEEEAIEAASAAGETIVAVPLLPETPNENNPDFIKVRVNEELGDGKFPGYRVVTKEMSDYFGMLYSLKAVEKIQSALTESNSPWRVPTKADWDELLNAMECEEDRNHEATRTGYYGKVAGKALKSVGTFTRTIGDGDGLWRAYNAPESAETTAGEDLVGFTALPLGNSSSRNNMMIDKQRNYDAEGFGDFASFWANTRDSQGNGYAKSFIYDTAMVNQGTFAPNSMRSVRLVKDYVYGNANGVENILGTFYPTKLVEGIHDDYKYAKVWTTINLYGTVFGGEELEEKKDWMVSNEWCVKENIPDEFKQLQAAYYINEWDGEKWYKKEMKEGDSVVILDGGLDESGDTIYNHEWRVYREGGLGSDKGFILIDTADAAKGEFQEEIDALNEKVDEFSAATVAEITRLDEKIDDESARAQSAETELHEEIVAETTRATEAEAALDTKIDDESARAQSAETELHEEIVAETDRATAAEESISGDVTTLSGAVEAFSAATVAEITRLDTKIDELSASTEAFSAATVAEITRLDEKIDDESARAQSAETELHEEIVAETTRATEAEAALDTKIDDESARAQSAETELQDEIDATQTGAGLESDGSYAPEASATYVSDASSLKDADTKLDTELARVEQARKDVTGQDTDEYVPNVSLTTRPIAYIADAESLNDADVKLDEAVQDLASKTIENIVVDGVTGVVENNIASVNVSGNSIPIGEYDNYSGRAVKPHPIHNEYSVLDAVKQLDLNFLDFTEKVDASLADEIGRATLAEQSISGIVNTFSAATVAFSGATAAEIARLDGRIDSTDNNVSELSASTETFSSSTVSEVARLDAKIEAETARAEASENSIIDNVASLSSSTESFSAATVSEIARIDATATRNKVKSTGSTIVVTEATEGTNLEVNIDGKTILSDSGLLKTGLKVAALAPGELEANVREAFRLVDNEGTPVDNTIVKIYKSSSLVSVELVTVAGTDYVRITYIDNEGVTQTMDLNIQQLVFEAEFKDGLVVNGNHEVRVKIDPTSEAFLTVSSEGVKVSGVQNAIDSAVAVETARATAAENSISDNVVSLSSTTASFSAATVAEVARLDGRIDSANSDVSVLSAATAAFSSSTVSEIARLDTKVEDETSRATAAENSISGSVAALSSVTATFSAETNAKFNLMEDAWNVPGSIKHTIDDSFVKSVAVGSAEDADKSLMRYYNDGTEHKYYASSNASDMYYNGQVLSTALDNMNSDIAELSAATTGEIARLDQKIDNEAARATLAETDLQENIDAEEARATSAEEALDDKIDELSAGTASDLTALQSALTEDERVFSEAANQLKAELDRVEEGAGLNGDGTYTPHNTVGDMGNYIALANSLDEADVLLDGALKNEETRATNAENSLSGAIDTLSSSTDASINDLKNQLDAANATISALTNELQALSGVVEAIQAEMADNIYATVKAILSGTSREIKITPDDANETLTIGFADDAVFGPISLGN